MNVVSKSSRKVKTEYRFKEYYRNTSTQKFYIGLNATFTTVLILVRLNATY